MLESLVRAMLALNIYTTCRGRTLGCLTFIKFGLSSFAMFRKVRRGKSGGRVLLYITVSEITKKLTGPDLF